MNDFIFEQKPGKKEIVETKYYTVSGQEEYIDDNGVPRVSSDNGSVLAKETIRSGALPKYSIKIGLNNKLVNPISVYGKEKESSFLDSICRADNKFIDVNPKTFQLYLNFLKTKNTSWLFNAEREMS